MSVAYPRNGFTSAVLVCGLVLSVAASGYGQDDIFIQDGNAGYIDLAIPGNQIRTIFDSGYGLLRPSRNEFFYAQRGPTGPGLPGPETSIDYQEASVYMEQLISCRVSAFMQVGMRAINPDLNNNSAGLADMHFGVKAAFVKTPDLVLSGQFRFSSPTGDADRGLGTNNINIEPGLLMFAPLDDQLALLGELRYWIPINGEDSAGPVLRYGLGAQYTLWRSPCCQSHFTPVLEFVGWTAFDGTAATPSPAFPPLVEDADGDTIVNVKIGARMGLGRNFDIYGGYGHALTGDRWYRDIVRAEIRYMF